MNKYDLQLCAGWKMQASSEVKNGPQEICRPDFDTRGWYPATVPSTVLAALVTNGVYKNPYFGMNLKEIPREPFDGSWWYRTLFYVSSWQAARAALLEFDGVNYGANIWLNGNQVADSREVKGAFRRFQYDVSGHIREGENVLAVEVIPPGPGDFSTGFVDWNPPPPDRNMGIFRGVRLRFCQGVSIEDPFVRTDLNAKRLSEATLTVTAEIANRTDRKLSGILEGEIDSLRFAKLVDLEPRQRKTVEVADLKIANPRLWWPHDMDTPELYDLHLKFRQEATVCGTADVRLGIRTVEAYMNEGGHKGFKINGKKILIKGAGWTDDLLLADTPETIDAQLKYVKHLNLNAIRLEGIWGKDHTLYDLCDRYGILVMAGWSCHWEHEQYLGKPVDSRYGGVTSPQDIELVAQSWQDQVLWLRNHPSIFVWAVASDKVPKPELERRYLETFKRYDPSRPYLASTGGVGSEQGVVGTETVVSDISGPSGVKMLGPYAYTPPIYWCTDTKRGGAYGFNTETSPGEAVPVLESIRKMIPQEHLWPIDEVWEFHCGLNEFNNLRRCQQAVQRRYGEPQSVEEFARKAQVLNYELMRPMFEAFRANRGEATGIIQWMLNAAWPKMYWQLYDKFLMPTGGFYGAKKACQPLHLLYNYADRAIYIVNDRLAAAGNLKATIRILDIHSAEVLSTTLNVTAEPESSSKIFELPELADISTTYFVDLRLCGQRNKEIANNFYWLSTRPDVLDYDAKVEPWPYYTPSKGFADFTAMNSLPAARVGIEYEAETVAEGTKVTTKLTSLAKTIAFFIELKICTADGETILPVFWDDNYVSLLPGETRSINAALPAANARVVVTADGWNLPR